jgi:hypothetical protein
MTSCRFRVARSRHSHHRKIAPKSLPGARAAQSNTSITETLSGKRRAHLAIRKAQG